MTMLKVRFSRADLICLMAEKHVCCHDLAATIGIYYKTLYKVINREWTSYLMMYAICKALDVEPERLILEEIEHENIDRSKSEKAAS